MRLRDPFTGGGPAVVTSLCLVLALALAPIGAGVAGASHQTDRTTDGFKAYTPGGEIPNPGDTMSVELYITPAFMGEEGPIPPEVEVRVDYQGYYTTTKSNCDTQDVYALGVDRGNDQAGTDYDEDLVQSLKQNGDSERSPADDPGKMTTNDDWDHRQFTWLDLAGEDSFQPTMNLNEGGTEDESILAVDGCVGMPDAGWHRTFGMLNGTIVQFHDDRESVTIDGEEYQEGDRFEIWESSLWYPVCDCEESRHVAMRLDPPPGKMTPGSEGGVYHPNGTIEAPYAEVREDGTIVYPGTEISPEQVTSEGIHYEDGFLELQGPIYYAAGHIEADGTIVTPQGERIEPDEDESPPPPTATPTPTASTTDTPGDDTPAGTPEPTATLSPDDDGEGDGSGDGDGGGDGSDPADTDGGSSGDAEQERAGTPTVDDAPGFGALGALAALLVAAVLLSRKP